MLHHREGSDIEGAVRRGLFDAIWRYDHVYDGYTVPRRYGTHFMKTGRVAAVAEEQRRKWQAEGRAPADAFWVRNRRNTGLVLVSPNPDPDAPVELPGEILGRKGNVTLVGQADIDKAFEPYLPEDARLVPAEHLGTDFGKELPGRLDYPDIPLKLLPKSWRSSAGMLDADSEAPVINLEKDRIANILANEPAVFEIRNSPKVKSETPFYELQPNGFWAYWIHQDVIEHEAKLQGVDPNLVAAIVYFENARGASYGKLFEFFGVSDTILPMNISQETWGDLVEAEASFSDPLVDIKAGVTLIRRIQERIKEPTVAKVASIYHISGRENVHPNGSRIAEFYARRPWEKGLRALNDQKLKTSPVIREFLERMQGYREELRLRLRSS